ncbi:MAG: hypothetical protein U5J95_02000 [Balneolaceae bacterium]|nr:hypothetical protein [Balneolaceae bacterium]
MKRFSNLPGMIVLLTSFMLIGCRQSLVIKKVDYSQPVETVLEPGEEGQVIDAENNISFNILPLQYRETKDTTSVTTEKIRMIRGREGFYYITASGYHHVYVMAPEKGSLKLERQIKINNEGLQDPAFNQRNPYVELLNKSTGETYALTKKGIAKPKTDKDEGGR